MSERRALEWARGMRNVAAFTVVVCLVAGEWQVSLAALVLLLAFSIALPERSRRARRPPGPQRPTRRERRLAAERRRAGPGFDVEQYRQQLAEARHRQAELESRRSAER